MRHWKLISLIALLAVTILPVPHALAVSCQSPGDCTILGIPEPGTFLLLGSGLVGLAGIAWRRNRRK